MTQKQLLRRALQALNTAPRFAVPSLDTDSYKIAAEIERAIRDPAALVQAARTVVARWERGDLAGAVRDLDAAVQEWDT